MSAPTKPTKARISRVWIERRKSAEENWSYGVIAKATVISERGTRQVLHSKGIWGILLGDVPDFEPEELSELRAELASFGFGTRAIDYAMKNVEQRRFSD